MVTRISIFGALLGALIMPLQSAATTAAVVPSSEAARTVIVKNLIVQEGSVSGTVVNKSSATVRDVVLSLQQVWQWKDERHPGADSPGRTLQFTLTGDVAPNASAPFTFKMPPLAPRSDGLFVTTMDVTGFTEVGP